MLSDKNQQQPFSNNQIEHTKPNAPMTTSLLAGHIAGSMNGGMNKVIAWKKVMAGEKHKEYRIKASFKMLTPLTPTYQDLTCTVRTFFVPNSRVWENAEKYTAQKGGASEIKIAEIPNLGGKKLPLLRNSDDSKFTSICNTTQWRDSFISAYLPRMGIYGYQTTDKDKVYNTFPKVSVLPLRGYVAIYNDFLRNKEYDEEIAEVKSDTVSDFELHNYFPNYTTSSNDFYFGRAKRTNSYYSDYRTEVQGFESTIPEMGTENGTDYAVSGTPVNTYSTLNSLITWAQWESKIAEARSQAENAQLNDWDVIARIRGSKKLTEGKVQLIGEKSFRLNYSSITQNAYNTNSNVKPEFQVMGTQGAYSYTDVDIPCYAGMIFNEEGYIHVIATVQAETVFESGFDRSLLNVTPLSEYRPDLVDEKYDALYKIEMSTEYSNDINGDIANQIVGYKRKFSELFKLPNIIQGDMTSNDYYEIGLISPGGATKYRTHMFADRQVITQKTFQFFETGYDWIFEDYEKDVTSPGLAFRKKIWRDYTDIQINKNQAIKNQVLDNEDGSIHVMGNNQIFFVGKAYCLADLPVDSAIKHNYTTWGEH